MPYPNATRRLALGIGVAGLALGIGAAVVLRSGSPTPAPTPSVQQLDLPGAPLGSDGTAPVTPEPAGQPVAPGSAGAAVKLFLQANARQDFATSYRLLDRSSRDRWRSVASWTSAQADRSPVTGVKVSGEHPAGPGAVEVTTAVTHPAAIDPFDGLTPGRTVEVWRASREGDAWRVAASPVSVQPVLPSDQTAPDAVRAWVDRLTRCDNPGAAALQATPDLVGPADLPRAPCRERGTWKVAAARAFEDEAGLQPYVAAFGPDVQIWARVVPVQGPSTQFTVVVAPLGDAWRVLGANTD